MKKISVPVFEFQSAIAKAFSVIPNRSILQGLENIELKVENNILSVRATDQEIEFIQSIEIKSKESQTVCIAGEKFPSLVALIKQEEDIFLTLSETSLLVETKKGKYNFNSKLFDLPSIKFESEELFNLHSDQLKVLIENSIFGVVNKADHFYPQLTGVNIRSKEDRLFFVGTDGKIFGRTGIKINKGITIDITIPAKTMNFVSKSLDGEIEIRYNNNCIEFSTVNINFRSRLIAETFPNYEPLLERGESQIILCSQKDLLDSLKRVLTMSDFNTKAIGFHVNENITLSCEDVENTGTETVECSYSGEELKRVVNGKNLQDVISRINTENVKISFFERKPIIIEPETQGEITFTGLNSLIKEKEDGN